MIRTILLLILVLGTVVAGCDSSTRATDEDDVSKFILIEDLDATGEDGRYTFFDLDDSTMVVDSASTRWDLAFKTTTILVNSGESGPGTARAALYEGLFDELTAVPGGIEWRSGGGAANPAIPSGSGSGWYNYSGPPNHLITPIPGRVILVETSEGNYAKLRIISYYLGAPEEPGSTESRYYTFEYVLSSGGSTSFE